jgi:D-alanine-D-alanine ligase
MSEPAAAPAEADRKTPLRALVLAGGLTFEREVSINSGGQVVEALGRAGR